MTTASPTPFGPFATVGHGRPRLSSASGLSTASRTLPRATTSAHRATGPRRLEQLDTFSHGQGFSADAPMLQHISYGDDSSDDEVPQPMKFSALTKAILEDRQPPVPPVPPQPRQPSPFRRSQSSLSRKESSRSAETRGGGASRAGTPSSSVSLQRQTSPPLRDEQARVSPPRVIYLSGTRQASSLRRAASSLDVAHAQPAQREVEEGREYITPAPAPRSRNVRSRANSTLSGHTSGHSYSSAFQSGPGSSSQPDSAGISSYESSQDQASHMSDDGQSRPSGRIAPDVMPGSTRVRRLNICSGTYLRGAPMRRPLRRRQSEEDQSAQESDRGNSMLEAERPYPRSESRPPSRADSLKRAEAMPSIHDFASNSQSATQPAQSLMHTPEERRNEPPVRPPSRQTDHASLTSHPPEKQTWSKVEDVPSRQPAFSIPAPPALPSFNNQENEPPPTFKRNKEQNHGILQIRDKPLQEESKASGRPARRMVHISPHRQVLAPKNINTPQRAAPLPPAPKMSALETATATAGASTAKSKKKRSHITVNGKIFSLKGRLGRGGSSDVYRVMAENDKMFALKKVNLEDCNEDTVRGYKGEIELLKKLESVERVVRLYDWEVNDAKQSLIVLMEIGESDLNRVLNSRTQPEDAQLDLPFVRYYWREMLQCVAAVHAHDIVHSDLKPANFLLVQGRLKLIDFGIANAIDTDNTVNVHRETNVGTPNYMSPESLQDTNANARAEGGGAGGAVLSKLMKVGKPSDVWSLGCILYQMTYGRQPFAHIPNQWNRVMAIINPAVEIQYAEAGIGGARVPASLVRLLRRCLDRDPSKRPTIAQLLDAREPFLHPDAAALRWEAEGAVPVSEHVLEQILCKIVERCRDPRRGCPTGDELKVYPRAFLDRVREMQGMT